MVDFNKLLKEKQYDANLSDEEKLRIIDEKIYASKQTKAIEAIIKEIEYISKKYGISEKELFEYLLKLNGVSKK